YKLQDAVVPLGIRHFQVLVEKFQEIEDMRNKRMNRQGNFSAGGPSHPSNHNQNRGRQWTKPYNHPQNNQGYNRSANQGT
ncbi:gag polyprotein, partial [Trifolium medium]|nr:gag polyprotein [Trifolium medium]